MTDVTKLGDGVLALLAALHSQGLATKRDDIVIRLEGRTFDQFRRALLANPGEAIHTTDVFDHGGNPARFRFVGVVFEQGPHAFR